MRIEDNRRSVSCVLEKLEGGECFEYGEAIMMKTDEGFYGDIRVVDIRRGTVVMLPPNKTVRLVDVKAVIE